MRDFAPMAMVLLLLSILGVFLLAVFAGWSGTNVVDDFANSTGGASPHAVVTPVVNASDIMVDTSGSFILMIGVLVFISAIFLVVYAALAIGGGGRGR